LNLSLLVELLAELLIKELVAMSPYIAEAITNRAAAKGG